MLTANRPERRTASCVALAALRQTSSIGGSSESDETALTVMPRGAPSSTVVITTTPVMKLPITRRNTVASKAGPAPGGVSTADMVFLLVERAHGEPVGAVRRSHRSPHASAGPGQGVQVTTAMPMIHS